MITYHLKLSGQDPRVLYSDMEFVAGDVGAYRLVFSFYDENTPLSLSDKILAVKIKRADGVVLSDSGEITDNTAVYIPKNDCFCVPGTITFEIALMDSAKNYITTKIIHASVLAGVGEPSAIAGDNSSVYVTLLAQTKNQLDAARELLTQTQNSLAEKADKATSLSGYGITDAYTKAEVDENLGRWKKIADITTTEEVNGIAATSEEFPDISKCKEFIVRAVLPKAPAGVNAALGRGYIYLNDARHTGYCFSATTLNADLVTEQRAHIFIADGLIYGTGTQTASGPAAVVTSVHTLIGERFLDAAVSSVICRLYDSANNYPTGTRFIIYGKVEG